MRSWLPFVVLTVLSWGTYIPTLHKGQVALGGSGVHAAKAPPTNTATAKLPPKSRRIVRIPCST